MSDKGRVYPEPGEVWGYPFTYNHYTIHSRTDDGWVRYNIAGQRGDVMPLYTMPTDRFMKTYQRVYVNNA